MTNQRHALVLSCEVPGEDPLPGARYNVEKLLNLCRRALVTASCVFGRRLTLDRAKEELKDFFSSESEGHILYGIFHGSKGAWKLSDGSLLGLDDILEQWDDAAKQRGTAQQLLIVSDSCESGFMVEKAKVSCRPDIAVQASCRPGGDCFDDKGYAFTDLLLWHLNDFRERGKMDSDKEKLLRNLCGPCYYCPDPINYGKGWVFINEHHSFGSLPLTPESSETWSRSSPPPELEEDIPVEQEDPTIPGESADPSRSTPKLHAWLSWLACKESYILASYYLEEAAENPVDLGFACLAALITLIVHSCHPNQPDIFWPTAVASFVVKMANKPELEKINLQLRPSPEIIRALKQLPFVYDLMSKSFSICCCLYSSILTWRKSLLPEEPVQPEAKPLPGFAGLAPLILYSTSPDLFCRTANHPQFWCPLHPNARGFTCSFHSTFARKTFLHVLQPLGFCGLVELKNLICCMILYYICAGALYRNNYIYIYTSTFISWW